MKLLTISNIDLVSALYRSILEREPDTPGLQAHSESISIDFSAHSLEKLIFSFLSSIELREKHNSALYTAALIPTPLLPVSLGSHCYTSAILKRNNLKSSSMPFDWLFSNLAMVNHCVEDNFETFLSRKYFEPVNVSDRMQQHVNLCNHSFYKNNFGVDFVFNHRDPTKPVDYDYYQRCVRRFLNCISDASKVPLFIATFRHSNEQIRLFEKLVRTLRSKRPDCRIVGLSIAEKCNTTPVEFVQSSEYGVYLSIIKPRSDWLDVRFLDPSDDLYILFKLADAARSVNAQKVGG